jgi:hypothetical protein
MTFTLTSYPRASIDLSRMWRDAPAFTGLGLLLVAALVPLYAAVVLDSRVFQGESPWLKPIKFHYALSIYLITLAFFARYASAPLRATRRWRVFVAVVCGAVLYEVLWIGAAASLNVASHFNDTSLAWTMAYALAGIGAVVLTSGSLGVGIAVARNKATGLAPSLQLSVWLGLVLTFVLTLVVAGYLSSNGSHFIGTSTRQLAILGWSRDAGDLRVAHFLATHVLHGLPLVGLIVSRQAPASARSIVILAALAYATLVLGTFAQALTGQPFLPWLG